MSRVHLSNQKTFEADAEVSLLDAARQANLILEHGCRTGRCGSCRAQVVSGPTRTLGGEPALSAAERDAGWILTCARSAAGDLWLDVEDLGPLADVPVLTLPCRIDSLERVAPDVMRVRLRLPPTANMRYLPGQYIDVRGPGNLVRSYSIANAPDASGRLELHVRRVEGGALSRYWFEQAAMGDLLRFEGPRGSFCLREVAGLDLVLLATGTGLAPVKALLEAVAGLPPDQAPRAVTLYWGNREEADLYWQPPAPQAGAPALTYVPVLSRAAPTWGGARGHVQDLALARHRWADCAVYACGAPQMIVDARALLLAHGLPARRFLSDAFVASGAAPASSESNR